MIMTWLDTLIGTLPSYASQQINPDQYYAIIKYIIAGIVLIFMISFVYRLFIAIFGRWVR